MFSRTGFVRRAFSRFAAAVSGTTRNGTAAQTIAGFVDAASGIYQRNGTAAQTIAGFISAAAGTGPSGLATFAMTAGGGFIVNTNRLMNR